MASKVYGYARVSSKEQNLDRQLIALREYGVEEKNIKWDKESGKDFNRESYQLLKNELLRSDDVLIIKELDRLGRNKIEIKKELDYFKEHHIRVKILNIPTTLIDIPKGNEWVIDMVNNILIEVLGAIAEEERLKIRKRQKEGINALKERNGGKGIGRPSIDYPDNWKEVYAKLKAKDLKVKEAMKLLNMKRTSFYKLLKKYNNK
ncbi:recombinase family protein [Clostridium butyricum]|uniref:recombinase family protein n=1 Tax=Clostridium butyricum TaxID=1492 RepID=UPI0006E4D6E8|nr:resolvase [Clostridium butyricum]